MLGNELFYLQRIAESLERIAQFLDTRSPDEIREAEGALCRTYTVSTIQGMSSSDAYDTAVAAIKGMPDDIPAAPVKEEKPVTKPEVVAALNQHAKIFGIESSKKVLASFGPKLDAIDPARYGDLLAQLGVRA